MSKGHVNRRSAGWVYVIDLPGAQAQRCETCNKRAWVELGRPVEICTCGASLGNPHAERRQISRSGFRTRKEAEFALRSFQADLDKGANPLPATTTVSEWAMQWLASERVKALRSSTRRRYEQLMRDWIIPELGSIEARQVRARHVRLMLEQAGAQMAPASVTQLRSVLSSMMASALEAELIDANPVAGVRRPKVDRPDLAVPTAEDLGRLMTAANNTTWAVPVLVSCTTGLRRGEVLGLRWKDIDLENGRLRVAKALQSVRDPEGTTALRLVDPKTDRSRRTVALPKITIERLRLAKREQAERRLQAGAAWHDLDLACDSGDRSPFHPDAFGKATKRLMAEAGLDPKTRLHDCRHAVATIMLQQGVHPAVASAMLGHSSVAFTMDTYQHVNDQMADQAADAIDDAFAAGVSGPN